MTDKNFFNALIKWIDDHTDEKISLDKVAKKSGYSKWYLNRMFTKHCGVSLGKYINNTRMQAASLSLRFTEATIAEVADQFNYDHSKRSLAPSHDILVCLPASGESLMLQKNQIRTLSASPAMTPFSGSD